MCTSEAATVFIGLAAGLELLAGIIVVGTSTQVHRNLLARARNRNVFSGEVGSLQDAIVGLQKDGQTVSIQQALSSRLDQLEGDVAQVRAQVVEISVDAANAVRNEIDEARSREAESQLPTSRVTVSAAFAVLFAATGGIVSVACGG